MRLRKYHVKITDPYAVRLKWNMTQKDFWRLLGVWHAGPKYERGRAMPESVEILFGIVYLGHPIPKPIDPREEEKKYANRPVFKKGQFHRKKRSHCYRPKKGT